MTDKLCVVGLGYIGLPTAALFAQAGLWVRGVDVSAERIAKVNAGEAPFREAGLDDLVARTASSGALLAGDQAQQADAFIVAVSTPIRDDRTADLNALEQAARAIGGVLRPGNLVVVESTVPPGTTAGLVRDTLEKTSGLVGGSDFHLAYCPERALPGRTLYEIVHNDRLIGGLTEACTAAAVDLYKRMVDGELLTTTTVTAETAKLAENTYRDVNIALANEISQVCEEVGADVWTVVSLANRHPRVHLHNPGPGVGGHCIPKDPWFLTMSGRQQGRIIPLGSQINGEQPGRVASRVLEMLRSAGAGSSAKVAILGVAYRGGVDDTRETPVAPIARALTDNGVGVALYDPYVKAFSLPLSSLDEALQGADMLLLLTDHPEFRDVRPEEAASLMRGRLVFDTRNLLDHSAWRASGFKVRVLGAV